MFCCYSSLIQKLLGTEYFGLEEISNIKICGHPQCLKIFASNNCGKFSDCKFSEFSLEFPRSFFGVSEFEEDSNCKFSEFQQHSNKIPTACGLKHNILD